jgi:hypothetical protein
MMHGQKNIKKKQHTYNVTEQHVNATIFAVEKQRLLSYWSVFICILIYPACNAHAG